MLVKEEIMKKIVCFICAVALLSISSFASGKESKNWYFSSRNQNDRPSLPAVDDTVAKGMGKDEKVVYLTFDAGYENGNVKKIVDILKENEVTGAFFVLRHFVEKNPDLIRTIKENGNLICHHTATHPNITALSKEDLKAEILELEQVMTDTLGIMPDPYFRPPEGCYSEESLSYVKEFGYRTVFWSLAWADWDNNNQKSYEYAMDKLTTRVHNGAVILLHPTSETNVKILPDFIAHLKSEGYRFENLNTLWDD